MLVNFTFQNFRSFRDEKTLSMEASSIKELKDSVIRNGSCNLLPAAVVYGANSSGKSNVLKALATMRNVVLGSVKLNPDDELDFDPFRLDVESAKKPTSFEIQFLLNDIKYRYGFDYDRTHILNEWLYEKHPKEREYNMFLRAGNDYEVSKSRFPEGLGKESSTPANRLFVSLVAQLNGKKSNEVLDWFKQCRFMSGLSGERSDLSALWVMLGGLGINFPRLKQDKQEVENFFQHANLGFNQLRAKGLPAFPVGETDELMGRRKDEELCKLETIHTIYDADGKAVGDTAFDKDEMESEGTKKIIELSVPLFNTLLKGEILVIDELEASLHPFLTRTIVQLFMNPVQNPKGAQLIFATHNTDLLDVKYLRRDQIWFTEKDKTESSDLYSLVEFRGKDGGKVRNDSSLQKEYLNGRFGAVPFMQ